LSGMDPQQAIADALQYFQRAATGQLAPEEDAYQQGQQADSNIRLNNLNQLAAGLGVAAAEGVGQLPEAAAPATAPAAAPDAAAPAAPEQPLPTVGAAVTPGRDIAPESPDSAGSFGRTIGTLLGFLGALLLLVGGIYVIYQLTRQRTATEAGVDAADATNGTYGQQPVDSFTQRAYGSWEEDASSPTSPVSAFSTTGDNAFVEPFDPEEAGTAGASVQTLPTAESPATDPETPPSTPPSAITVPLSEQLLAASSADPLDEFTAEYDAGMPPGYEERRNIQIAADEAARGSRHIGEYGMGVNIKHGVLKERPEQVTALDVWLFDKSDESDLHTRTCVLLSQYALDHGLEDALQRDRSDAPRTITPEPGLRFQIEGNSLVLDGEVLDVEHVPDGEAQGIFANVSVQLQVYARHEPLG